MNPKNTKRMLRFLFLAIIVFVFKGNLHAQEYARSLDKHRENYKADFIKEARSPLKEDDLQYLDFYAGDESYLVTCTFEMNKKSKTFQMATYSGATKAYQKFGVLHFELNGAKHQLAVYRSLDLANNPLYRDYLFLPFKDLTNAHETYGGGRYIDLRMKDLEQKPLVIDFNKAYNPYCAYSNGYSCPVPPKENHLSIKIEAGEKNFKKEH